MFSFYKRHSLSKSGQGVGGKFNGVDIRFIMKENHLQELSSMLPVEAEPFLNYLRSIKELHSATVSKEFSLENVKVQFSTLKSTFGTYMRSISCQ